MTPLHQFGDALRHAFLQIPLGIARLFFVLFLLAILIWVLTLSPRNYRIPDTRGLTGNLKFWAALALITQLVIYLLL